MWSFIDLVEMSMRCPRPWGNIDSLLCLDVYASYGDLAIMFNLKPTVFMVVSMC